MLCSLEAVALSVKEIRFRIFFGGTPLLSISASINHRKSQGSRK
jgi:hypothetical protein